MGWSIFLYLYIVPNLLVFHAVMTWILWSLECQTYYFLELYAPWCGHCKELAPVFESAAKEANTKNLTFKFAAVNAEEHQDLSTKFEVKGYPTIVFIDNKKGEIIKLEIVDYAFVGKGIDDKNALLRLSISPSGIQTMVFRANRRSEFMEPYSEDGKGTQ